MVKIFRAQPHRKPKKRKSIWVAKKSRKAKPKHSIWVQSKPKQQKPKRSIWVSKNPQPKKSIWINKQPGTASSYRTVYIVYQLQGTRARKIKAFRDQQEAQSWVQDKQVQFPYNAYKISHIDKKRGW